MDTIEHVAQLDDGISARVSAFSERRETAKAADRYFYLQPTTGPTNHTVTMTDGREMVMMASYSYLGLIGHPRIDAAAKAAVDKYGTGAGGVRLLTGTTDLHEELEARIAAFNGREDAARLLLRLRHEHRDHHGAHSARETSSSWTSSTTRRSWTDACCPGRSGRRIATTT